MHHFVSYSFPGLAVLSNIGATGMKMTRIYTSYYVFLTNSEEIYCKDNDIHTHLSDEIKVQNTVMNCKYCDGWCI